MAPILGFHREALAQNHRLRARDLSGRASRRLWWSILKAFNREPGRSATLETPSPGDIHA